MKFMSSFFYIFFAISLLASCNQTQEVSKRTANDNNPPDVMATDENEMEDRLPVAEDQLIMEVVFPDTPLEKIEKTDEEWRRSLSEEAFYVLRQAGTERSFTGEYWNNKASGVYTCGGCQLPLFHSDTKFKSGTGWPSFYEPIQDAFVAEHSDVAYGMVRTEVVCARCDGHLGHVFDDGPAPTGLRYCINSVSLNFVEK